MEVQLGCRRQRWVVLPRLLRTYWFLLLHPESERPAENWRERIPELAVSRGQQLRLQVWLALISLTRFNQLCTEWEVFRQKLSTLGLCLFDDCAKCISHALSFARGYIRWVQINCSVVHTLQSACILFAFSTVWANFAQNVRVCKNTPRITMNIAETQWWLLPDFFCGLCTGPGSWAQTVLLSFVKPWILLE